MKRGVILGSVLTGLWFVSGCTKPVETTPAPPPPVMMESAPSALEAPLQIDVDKPYVFQMNGYELRTLAQFALTARVLSTQGYVLGRESDLSPLDVAFGWGRMSERDVVGRLTISQGNRWYQWHYDGDPPIPFREIETSSANMHLIPADREVARTMSDIRTGQIVSLRGYLVEAHAQDGWTWRSSLSRDDTGQGACEVIFVQAVTVH